MNILAAVCWFLLAAPLAGGTDPELRAYTSNLPFAMPELQLPEIPAFTIRITDFGAVGDGIAMNTDAIAAAVRRCAEKGGGVVVVPPGMWLTGPIRLESRVNFHLDSGAVILFSKRFEEYPMFARPKSGMKCVPMIYGSGLTDVAVTGRGLFDGNGQYWRPVKKEKMTERQWKQLVASGGAVTPDGKMWWPSKEAMNGQEYLKALKKQVKKPAPEQVAGARELLRPVMLALDDCKKVLLDGPTFANAPGWTLSPARCEGVVIRNVTVNNPWWGQNTDALDINSSSDLLLYNSVFSAGDDAICVKPGKPSDFRSGPACENIVVANCTVYHGHGGFVIGSETYGGARNISVRNCTFIGTDIGLRFKSAKDRGGIVEKVFVDGIRMKDIAGEAILFDMSYDNSLEVEKEGELVPQYRDFRIENVACDGASDAIVVRGLPEMAIKDIHFRNIAISSARGCTLEDAEGIEAKDLKIMMTSGPVWSVSNALNVHLEGVTYPSGAALYLQANGEKTSGISLHENDVVAAKLGVHLGNEVPANAVTIDSASVTTPMKSGDRK